MQCSPPLEYCSRKLDDLVALDPYSLRRYVFLDGPFMLYVNSYGNVCNYYNFIVEPYLIVLLQYCIGKFASLVTALSLFRHRFPPCMFLINHPSPTRTLLFSLAFFLYLVSVAASFNCLFLLPLHPSLSSFPFLLIPLSTLPMFLIQSSTYSSTS